MATVRFSQELKDAIIKSATHKMHKPLEEANSPIDTEWGMRIYNTLFGEHLPAIHKVPAHFFKTAEAITLWKVGEVVVNRGISLGAKVVWPVTFPDTIHAKLNNSYSGDINIIIHPDSPFQEFHEHILARKQKIDQAVARQSEFVDMVKKVIEAHATLAPALKMWSPLWDLIPDSYKERHRLVVERTKSEVTVDVDFTKLTAMATAAKLRG
jgi:hypothetical protein